MFFNEGIDDRTYGVFKANKNITTDIHVDNILNNAPPDKIYFSTDWHVIKYNDKLAEFKINPDVNKLVNNERSLVGDDGVFIFLGDMMDDECKMYDKLPELIGDLKGYKIFILGNNDLQPESYYIDKLGFDNVFEAYQWNKFTFSHQPIEYSKRNTQYNIHGHMHQFWDYSYDGTNYDKGMIKLYYKDDPSFFISLADIIRKYNNGYYINSTK